MPAWNVVLLGERVANDEIKAPAIVLHILDEVVEEQVDAKVAVFGSAWVKPQLVYEQFGRVEYAGGLGEEFVFGCAVSSKVWLVQGPRRLFDNEIGREPRIAESLDDLLSHAAHRHRLIHLLACSVEQVPLIAFERVRMLDKILPHPRGEEVELPFL